MKDVEVCQTKEFQVSNPLVVAGFVDAGVVGPIALDQITRGLRLDDFGYVRSRYLPPAAVFVQGKLRYPFRIYGKADGSILATICELPMRSVGLQAIANSLADWMEKKSAKEIVVLGGIGVAILTPATMFIPDPRGAAQLVKSFNEVYGYQVSTANLEKEATKIRDRLREIADQYKRTISSEQKRYAPEALYT